MKVFINTNIPIYAAGKEHPLKRSCLDILDSIARDKMQAYTDTEVFQEILYRYFYSNQRENGLKIFDLFARIMQSSILPVRQRDIMQARLLAENEAVCKLSPRDLVHLAIMLNNDIRHILTTDRGFSAMPGIKVISS